MELLKKLAVAFGVLWLTIQIVGTLIGLSILGIIVFEIIKVATAH